VKEVKHRQDINVRALLDGLTEILPAQAVISDPASLRAWECDGLPLYCELPLAVVMPRAADEVAAVMSLCHRLDVPVVPRGSGTGLSAGAMPHPEGIVISLAGLDRIVDIDAANRIARVQPGVTNLSISEAAAAYGLLRAGPLLPDRLLDWRQRCRECRWRALPEIRPHGA